METHLCDAEKLMSIYEAFSEVGNILGSSLKKQQLECLSVISRCLFNGGFFTSSKAWTAKQVSHS